MTSYRGVPPRRSPRNRKPPARKKLSNKERKEFAKMRRDIRNDGLMSVDLERFKELRQKDSPQHRTTYLKHSTKRIPARRADPAKRRFAALRDKAFQGFVREHPCCFPLCQTRCRVECAHIKTRGSGGQDVGNCAPLCSFHHAMQHILGIRTFQREHKVDLQAVANNLADQWRAADSGEGGSQ